MNRFELSLATCLVVAGGWIGSAAQAAEKPKEPAASIAELFEGLPADAQPDPKTGWSAEAAAKATQWLLKTNDPRRIRLVVSIRAPKVVRAPSPLNPGRDWHLMFLFDLPPLTVNGANVEQKVTVSPQFAPGRVDIAITDAEAKTAESLKNGDKVTLAGLISGPMVLPKSALSRGNAAVFQLGIVGPSVELPGAAKPGAKPDEANTPPKNAQPKPPAFVPAPPPPFARPKPTPPSAPVSKEPITDVNRFLAQMPAEVAPDTVNGWSDTTRLDKASQWVTTNATGRPVKLRLQVRAVYAFKDDDGNWAANYDFEPLELKLKNESVTVTLRSAQPNAFRVHGTEAQVKQLQKLYTPRSKSVVELDGVIREAQFGRLLPGKEVLKLLIDDPSVPEFKK